jgi:hypothetical protein
MEEPEEQKEQEQEKIQQDPTTDASGISEDV